MNALPPKRENVVSFSASSQAACNELVSVHSSQLVLLHFKIENQFDKVPPRVRRPVSEGIMTRRGDSALC